jgi:hypothetical protein
VVVVNVLQSGQNLAENALHTGTVERLVVTRLHQLVEVAIHVFHGDVELLAHRVKEDVVCRHEVRMVGKILQKDDLTQLETLRKVLESLLEAYHCPASNSLSASAPRPAQSDTTEAAITNVLEDLVFVFKAQRLL